MRVNADLRTFNVWMVPDVCIVMNQLMIFKTCTLILYWLVFKFNYVMIFMFLICFFLRMQSIKSL